MIETKINWSADGSSANEPQAKLHCSPAPASTGKRSNVAVAPLADEPSALQFAPIFRGNYFGKFIRIE